ncbi:MAG: preprotein translocase subunit SecE [Propionibacteriaceae bacterium]|nr:preprotein translocase subunit SecE [Propionibacteriaceae bacterium]
MNDKTPASDEQERSTDPVVDPAEGELEAEESEQAVLAQAEAVITAAPVPRKLSKAPVRKNAPTPKRSDKHRESFESDRRVGPVTFVKQSVGELKQVNWPTTTQLRQYFFAVLIFVLFVITYVSLLDLGFGALLLRLLG